MYVAVTGGSWHCQNTALILQPWLQSCVCVCVCVREGEKEVGKPPPPRFRNPPSIPFPSSIEIFNTLWTLTHSDLTHVPIGHRSKPDYGRPIWQINSGIIWQKHLACTVSRLQDGRSTPGKDNVIFLFPRSDCFPESGRSVKLTTHLHLVSWLIAYLGDIQLY